MYLGTANLPCLSLSLVSALNYPGRHRDSMGTTSAASCKSVHSKQGIHVVLGLLVLGSVFMRLHGSL